ncbi:hypothetical protein ACFYWY_29765 [Streptomyces sp. NPDC002870]|uniref:hypothetical protein n=1 Tax=Streptomyces sp. NPDC002870 TaxID=3364666 RepID=UPI00369C833A
MSEAASAKIPSDSSGLDQLVTAYDGDALLRGRLLLGDGWPHRWSSTWQVLTTFCRLDELGLEAVGQLLEPDQAVIECRHPAAFTD